MAANLSDIELADWLIGPQLIGAIFILAALLQKRFPPKKINSLYGYRTPQSMKNQQNWDEGNRYSAKLMLKFGAILLISGLIITLLFLCLPIGTQGKVLIKAGMLVAGAIGSVVIMMVSTRAAFRKNNRQTSVMQYFNFGDDEQPAISPDEFFMNEALKEARQALAEDEIPIGAVVVCKGKIIGRGHNLTERLNDVSAHAEMQALTAAANYMGGKYLPECTLYVTLEPCVMCAGASYWFQVGRIVFGAYDTRMGFGRLNQSVTHPKTLITSGIQENECSQLIKDFFKGKRKK